MQWLIDGLNDASPKNDFNFLNLALFLRFYNFVYYKRLLK